MKIHKPVHKTPPCVYASESSNVDKFLSILKRELSAEPSNNHDCFVSILKKEITNVTNVTTVINTHNKKALIDLFNPRK